MSAKEQATQDIQNELSKSGKQFIQFIKELDPVMDALVEIYTEKQEGRPTWCVNTWTKK